MDARSELGDGRGESGVAGVGGEARIALADHPHTRAGRADHRLRVVEDLDEPAHERRGLTRVAGVEVHLTAAGLLLREVHLVAEALEQVDGRSPGLRVERVRQAGDEDGGAHR